MKRRIEHWSVSFPSICKFTFNTKYEVIYVHKKTDKLTSPECSCMNLSRQPPSLTPRFLFIIHKGNSPLWLHSHPHGPDTSSVDRSMGTGQEEQRWCGNPLHPCSTYETLQTHKQERGESTEEEEKERGNMKDGKIQLTRKKPAIAVMMDSWSEGVRKVLCKLPRQPSHALVIRASGSHVQSTDTNEPCYFSSLQPPLGGFFLILVPEGKKKISRMSMSLPNSQVPAPSAKAAGSRDVACISTDPPPPGMLNRHLQTAFCLDQWSVWLYQAPWLCLRFKDIT